MPRKNRPRPAIQADTGPDEDLRLLLEVARAIGRVLWMAMNSTIEETEEAAVNAAAKIVEFAESGD